MPAVTLKESTAIRALAECLYDFLPAGGAKMWKGHINFGTVARKVGVDRFWPRDGSKLPRLVSLLEGTLQYQPRLLEPLIVEIVRAGITYRGKDKPLTPEEIERIKGHLYQLGLRIPSLWDEGFSDALGQSDDARAKAHVEQARRDDETRITDRQRATMRLDAMRREFERLCTLNDPQSAGLQLEPLIKDLCEHAGLFPSKSFKIVGEQIDGVFELDNEVYLVEAKWTEKPVPEADLLVFHGKVVGKSNSTRGVLFSLLGASVEAQAAIVRGKQPVFFVVEGYDLMQILQGAIPFDDYLRRRRRLLAGRGKVFASFDETLAMVR